MKEKEKINWGLLVFIVGFCWCLKIGMHLDLKNQDYPNNLNNYQEVNFLTGGSTCGNAYFMSVDTNTNNEILNTIIFDGAIR